MHTSKAPKMMLLTTFALAIGTCSAFSAPKTFSSARLPVTALEASSQEDANAIFLDDRRNALKTAGIAAASFGILPLFPGLSFADEGVGSTPESPIVIIGAGGKVGKICTRILSERGLYTKALTRSGRQILDGDSKFVSYAPGDVTKIDQLKDALKGASGIIYAASASGKKKGGDPSQVDYLGVYNAAKVAIELGVPKFVLISAGTVTRPDSAGFKATNFFVKYVYGDRIMDNKMAGEAVMRDLYNNAPGLAYSVVRPGGLSDEPSVGSDKVHVSQGDIYSSEVSREDVALVTIAALLDKSADNTTFELNQLKGLGKAMGSLPDAPAELVHAGSASFDGLLDGLLTDKQMKEKYASIINDSFRGNGVEPIEKLSI